MACSISSCRSQVCRTSELSFGDTTHPRTFLPPTAIATVTSGSDNFAVSDLNGDGLLDIVISDTSDHYAGVLLQNPTHPGTFLGAKYVGPIQSEPLIADMNRDGISDLVLFRATLDNTASAE
jgi:hypothetical protein